LRAGKANPAAGLGSAFYAAEAALEAYNKKVKETGWTHEEHKMTLKKAAVNTARGAAAGYGKGSVVWDAMRGAAVLKNKAMGKGDAYGPSYGKASVSDFAPLAIAAAVGALEYRKPPATQTYPAALGNMVFHDPNQPSSSARALARGTEAYGVTSAVRDAYQAYNEKRTPSKSRSRSRSRVSRKNSKHR
jgi:hypothetical protein